MFAINDREDLEQLAELASLKNQVNEVRLLGEQNFHQDMKNVFEPVSKSLKDVSEEVTKTMTENSIENNQVLENFNDKLLEIIYDRGIRASYLLSPLSEITNPDKTSQLNLV